MSRRCVALLSGGLDSMLAIRLMQEQGIEVEALNFKTVFTCCQDHAGQAARDLNVRVTIVGQEDDYLQLVQNPKYGYGKGANPCVDCRIYMFQKAKTFMDQIGADFIVSGELIGQRPMSQKRRDLDTIAYHSELEDLLLRPLSAKLLPPTLPEREKWVDRRQLYGFEGRGRKKLIRLAKQLGIDEIPTPSTGCALTEPRFSRKVFDLVQIPAPATRWDFELLKYGRHFRIDPHTKIVVGRHQADNDALQYMHELPQARSTAMLFPKNFKGPCTLIVGPATESTLETANSLLVRYSNRDDLAEATIRLDLDGETKFIRPVRNDDVRQLMTVATYQ